MTGGLLTDYTGIAIAGKAGAGKTRFAQEIEKELIRRSYAPIRLAFADALKDEVEETYGVKKGDPGAREKLIEHGMARREQDVDYWVDALAFSFDLFRSLGNTPVIHDMRFRNEYDWAYRKRCLLVRLDATHTDRTLALSGRREDVGLAGSDHPSETDLDQAEYHLRFWNPHGGVIQLVKLACLVVDEFSGLVESAA